MIKLLATTILSLSILGGGATAVPIQQTKNETQNEIHIQTQTENLTNIQWHNNSRSLSNDNNSLKLFDKYSIDIEEAERSLDVYIQEEYVPFEEIIPVDYVNANSDIALMNLGDSQEQEFEHNEGYIKFVTKAYALGFYDGQIVYHIEVTTEQLKSFFVNKNDNLIIRHGSNAVTLNHQNCPAKGRKITPVTIYTAFQEPVRADEIEDLSPNYSCADGGVYYTFSVGGPSSSGDTTSVIYGNTTVVADYYLTATDTTAVQPTYVHNQSWFVESLSISFGPIGASVNVNKSHDTIDGTIMNLKGYAKRITQNVYTLNPVDWGFEGRYYFQSEGLKCTTKTLENDFTISTERLRCGFIEGEYINLSPNRLNAGDAYLQLTFNKPIYEINTYLSFWSAAEGLYFINGDYAYLQYLDANGNWITFIDLLTSNLPTDRTAQKYFEYEFIEGTYGIRFIAHKENPTTGRNKGRICIGKTKFITCEID